MKTAHLSKIFLVCLSFGFFACSSDDSNNSTGDDNPPVATEGNFTKRLLVEDYTGTWCANCPNVAHAIDLLKVDSPNQVVAVGIHRESSDPSNANYDPFNFDATLLQNKYDIYGVYPSAMLDRATQWTYPVLNNTEQALALIAQDASIGLSINPTVSAENLNVDLKIKFGSDFTTKSLKVVVYILESGLVYDQTNGTSYYDGQNPIPNFEYNHVLRASITNLLGDAIPAAETSLDNVYTTSISIPVSQTNVSNLANMHIVAFVVDSQGNALNARSANVGDTQSFQEI